MTRSALGFASLFGLATVQASMGAPVVFNNTSPGFAWRTYSACSGSLITGEYLFLDVTLPAHLQPLSDDNQNNCFGRPANTVSRFFDFNGLQNPGGEQILISAGMQFSRSAPFPFQIFGSGQGFPFFMVTPPRVYADREIVGPSADWTSNTDSATFRFVGGGANGVPLARGSGAWGFRLTLAGQTHYAFVAFKLQNNGVWVPTTWGYESSPDTPIAAVVPACLRADLNNDRVVDVNDLTVFLGSFGSYGQAHFGSDVNGDLAVNTADLVVMLSSFGCAM